MRKRDAVVQSRSKCVRLMSMNQFNVKFFVQTSFFLSFPIQSLHLLGSVQSQTASCSAYCCCHHSSQHVCVDSYVVLVISPVYSYHILATFTYACYSMFYPVQLIHPLNFSIASRCKYYQSTFRPWIIKEVLKINTS